MNTFEIITQSKAKPQFHKQQYKKGSDYLNLFNFKLNLENVIIIIAIDSLYSSHSN